MQTQELEKIIRSSLDDFKLDTDEKYLFKDLSKSLKGEQLRFIKNKSFEITRFYIEKADPKQLRHLFGLKSFLKQFNL